MKEIWKPIANYEGLYCVSNIGNIKSLHYNNRNEERILKTKIDRYGYKTIGLTDKNHKRKWFTIHRLVALTFIPNPNNYPCVNHKDENKLNNNVENLEWCTVAYNNSYNNRINRIAKTHYKKVLCVELNKIFDSQISAANFVNHTKSNISACCLGRQKTCGGYHWKFLEGGGTDEENTRGSD